MRWIFLLEEAFNGKDVDITIPIAGDCNRCDGLGGRAWGLYRNLRNLQWFRQSTNSTRLCLPWSALAQRVGGKGNMYLIHVGSVMGKAR